MSVLKSQQWIVPDRCQRDDTVPLWVCIALRLCSDRGREADVDGPRRFSPGWGFGRESSDISAGSGRPAHYRGLVEDGGQACVSRPWAGSVRLTAVHVDLLRAPFVNSSRTSRRKKSLMAGCL